MKWIAKYLLWISLSVLSLLFAGCVAETVPSIPPSPTLASESQQPGLTSTPSSTPAPTALPATDTPTATLTDIPSPTSTPTITPLPPRIVDDFGVPMVLVPAGPFVMGRNDYSGSERPAHNVTLESYYIDQYEVTFASYAQFLNERGNQFEGLANWIEANDPDLHVRLVDGVWWVDAGFENYPMNEMTWYGARAYCEWRGGHLPTEAQWEKAARGPDERTYPWGEGVDCSLANYAGCAYAAVPVDSYPGGVSPYGVYQMSGNMMEWTNDWYNPAYYANSPQENPQGPESGDFKIIRGGSWINNYGTLRTTYRYPKLPVLTYTSVGFRCARDVMP